MATAAEAGKIAVLIPLMRPEKLRKIESDLTYLTPTARLYAAADMNRITPLVTNLCERVFWDFGNTYARRINLLAAETYEPYMFLGADDIKFSVGWDECALAAMLQPGVVGVNDLHNPHPTHLLVSRAYIEEFGSGTLDNSGLVLHPYKHNFCDLELVATAKKRGRYYYAKDAIVAHLHPAAGKAEDDEIYALGRQSYEADLMEFESRKHLWA